MPSSDADNDVVRCPRRMWTLPLCWLIFNLLWFCLMMYFWSLLLMLLLLTFPSSLNGGDDEPLYDCMLSPGLEPNIALSQAVNKNENNECSFSYSFTSIKCHFTVIVRVQGVLFFQLSADTAILTFYFCYFIFFVNASLSQCT